MSSTVNVSFSKPYKTQIELLLAYSRNYEEYEATATRLQQCQNTFVENVKQFPEMYKLSSHLLPIGEISVREFVHSSYRICYVYNEVTSNVEVLTIMGERQDIIRHLTDYCLFQE